MSATSASSSGSSTSFSSSVASSTSDTSNPDAMPALYLDTFIATLCLLVFISCGLVLRSMIMRRRYRALLAAGITPPTGGNRSRRTRDDNRGPPPLYYEAHIGAGGPPFTSEDEEKGKRTADFGWEGILPLATSYSVNPPSSPKRERGTLSNTPAQSTSRTLRSHLAWLFPPGHILPLYTTYEPGRPDTTTTQTLPPPPTFPSPQLNPPPEASLTPGAPLQVAVLIAMPSSIPIKPYREEDKEDEVPYVEIGIAKVAVVGGEENETISEGYHEV